MVPVMKHDVETRVWDGVVDHGYPHRWAGLNSEVDDRTMRSQHSVTWYYYLSRIQSYPDCGWGCKENITSQATNSPERPNYKATGLIQPAEGSAESQIPTTVTADNRGSGQTGDKLKESSESLSWLCYSVWGHVGSFVWNHRAHLQPSRKHCCADGRLTTQRHETQVGATWRPRSV